MKFLNVFEYKMPFKMHAHAPAQALAVHQVTNVSCVPELLGSQSLQHTHQVGRWSAWAGCSLRRF